MQARTFLKPAAIAVLLFAASALAAQSGADDVADVFIGTDPIGAAVILNGEPMEGATPLLIRDLPAGRYELTLLKSNHPAVETEIEVAGGAPVAFSYPLPRGRFIPAPYETALTLAGSPIVAGEKGVSLPEGSYRFSWNDQTLDIRPVFPADGTIRALDILAPGLIVLAGVMMGEELVWDQEEYFSVSPFSVGMATVGGVLGIVDLRLRSQRREHARRIDPVPVGRETATAEAELLFQEANEAFASGRTAEALDLFEELIGSHRDSGRIPEALYTLGRIRLITGEPDLAAAEFRLVIERYPDPAVFDRACKALSDYHLLQGDYRGAIRALDSIVYIDPAFEPEDIAELVSSYRELTPAGGAE